MLLAKKGQRSWRTQYLFQSSFPPSLNLSPKMAKPSKQVTTTTVPAIAAKSNADKKYKKGGKNAVKAEAEAAKELAPPAKVGLIFDV